MELESASSQVWSLATTVLWKPTQTAFPDFVDENDTAVSGTVHDAKRRG